MLTGGLQLLEEQGRAGLYLFTAGLSAIADLLNLPTTFLHHSIDQKSMWSAALWVTLLACRQLRCVIPPAPDLSRLPDF